MRRSIVLYFSLLAILLVPNVGSWAADRIVLKDGNVVEGEIVRTTGRDITVKGRFGMITFPLKQVRRVREDGKYWIPAEPGEDHTPQSEAPRASWGDSPTKQLLLRSIAEIEANPLGEWTTHPKEPAPERAPQPYRLLKDGRQSFSSELPRPGEFDRVWVHRREHMPSPPGGLGFGARLESKSTYFWVPLYWHEGTNRWLPTHPRQSAFRWEENEVRKLLVRLASGKGAGLARRINSIVDKLESSPADQTQLKNKLKQLTKLVAGDWGGENILYGIYMKNLAITQASEEEKVALARSRRAELRQLINLMP